MSFQPKNPLVNPRTGLNHHSPRDGRLRKQEREVISAEVKQLIREMIRDGKLDAAAQAVEAYAKVSPDDLELSSLLASTVKPAMNS